MKNVKISSKISFVNYIVNKLTIWIG